MKENSDNLGLWWTVLASCSAPDDIASSLMEMGASGAHIESDRSLRAFVRGSEVELQAFLDEIKKLELTITSVEKVVEQNWLANCAEVWEELSVGKLKVVPAFETGNLPASDSLTEIVIRPGMGFGTGHHATTKTVIELLQDASFDNLNVSTALDIGTGSGILAVAIAKLFKCNTLGIDNDIDALANAKENVELNKLSDKIKLSDAGLSTLTSSYNLIAANIYAEVLCQMEPDIKRLLAPNGRLILSGIMSSKLSLINENFISRGWTVTRSISLDGWESLLLQDNSKPLFVS